MKRAGKKDPNRTLRRRISRDAVNYMVTLTEAILRCEFGFGNEDMDKFTEAMNKYSGFISRNDIKMDFKYFREYGPRKRKEEEDESGKTD